MPTNLQALEDWRARVSRPRSTSGVAQFDRHHQPVRGSSVRLVIPVRHGFHCACANVAAVGSAIQWRPQRSTSGVNAMELYLGNVLALSSSPGSLRWLL